MDCPIADFADSQDLSMVVSVHNPSNLAMAKVEVKVPHKNLKAERFNGEIWEAADSSVICNA